MQAKYQLRRLRRVATACAGFAIGIAGPASSAASNGALSRAVPVVAYEHAQTLVALASGRRLNLFCLGTGTPTVVLEAGGGDDSLSFRHIQGRLAATTRVCSYDRAGMGFSDPSDGPSTASHVVEDLHALLRQAQISLPAVLVGHSDGGLYVTLYAAKYPKEVAGLVLIDPDSPGLDMAATKMLDQPWLDQWRAINRNSLKEAQKCLDLAHSGSLARTPSRYPNCLDDPTNPDHTLHRLLNAQLARATEQEAIFSEDWDTSSVPNGGLSNAELACQRVHFDLGDKPLIVLSGTHEQDGLPLIERRKVVKAMLDNQGALASHSTRGKQILINSSTEYLQDTYPAVVTRAVDEVVQEARKGLLAQ
ncbi:alpha/beta fold hydrolase [Dyella sp. 20L07]|uniref:alpha/beta fold hydrolase n=1 Tax=Dyella sp. 20L07 TaxID=3384240 RepID=UPI003D26DE93